METAAELDDCPALAPAAVSDAAIRSTAIYRRERFILTFSF
jgi:hypothetical protein